mgnify:CR=1 FL=1
MRSLFPLLTEIPLAQDKLPASACCSLRSLSAFDRNPSRSGQAPCSACCSMRSFFPLLTEIPLAQDKLPASACGPMRSFFPLLTEIPLAQGCFLCDGKMRISLCSDRERTLPSSHRNFADMFDWQTSQRSAASAHLHLVADSRAELAPGSPERTGFRCKGTQQRGRPPAT